MSRKVILIIVLSFIVLSINAQNYQYSINLNNIEKDKLKVELKCPAISSAEIIYYFPKTIPGTYEELNYGRYISKFSAYDKNGEELEVKKIDINSYLIYNANTLKTIKYKVDDTFDERVKKKHKIFEPAGTGFEKDEYFVLNAGGVFGCFLKMENIPFILNFIKSESLSAYSSLNKKSEDSNKILIEAKDYHQLIDCPILFTNKKAEQIEINNCTITIASYSDNDSTSYIIKKEVEPLLKAIQQFTGTVPVQEYNILLLIEDQKEIGKMVNGGKINIFKVYKLFKVLSKGYGGLEHGTSTFCYLPDMGKGELNYTFILKSLIIHEFMHIYTPLNLHSNLIANFNYSEPKMSKHLWLYEGVTEYFSNLIQMQGGLTSVDSILKQNIKWKIISGLEYPDSIPFTKMSKNILEHPYKSLYPQVYERGAMMAMLLDFEIMKLTKGEKTLKSVIFELSEKYGQNKSFDEENFISEFVGLVHPNLQQFFDDYVTGTKPLDYEKGFEVVGITFYNELKSKIPIEILTVEDNGVKLGNFGVRDRYEVKKVGENDIVGFEKGDKVNPQEAFQCFFDKNNNIVSEGTIVTLPVLRGNKEVKLSFPAKLKDGYLLNVIKIKKDMTPMQEKLFKLWTTGHK